MRTRRLLAPVLLTTLVVSGISPALAADEVDEVEEVDEIDETENGGLEAKIDRPTVTLGDEIELEIELKRELDDEREDEGDDGEDEEEGDDGDDADDADDAEADDAGNTEEEDVDRPEDSAVLPSSVTFSVDYGDGSAPLTLSPDKQKADDEEFEAEAETTYVYATEGDYAVTVTATPDVGEPVTVGLDVTVTTEPVAYGRRTDLVCPDGVHVPGHFADVRPGGPHAAMVDCLATRGLIRGRSSDEFSPAADVSRAQMASFLVRLLEETDVNVPADVDDAFADDNGNTHEASINRLAALGLLAGTDGEVRPNGALTRDQLASLLVRTLELAGVNLQADADYFGDDNGSVHEAAINLAAASGLTTGRTVGEYQPRERLTRAQLATFLARALDLVLSEQAAA